MDRDEVNSYFQHEMPRKQQALPFEYTPVRANLKVHAIGRT